MAEDAAPPRSSPGPDKKEEPAKDKEQPLTRQTDTTNKSTGGGKSVGLLAAAVAIPKAEIWTGRAETNRSLQKPDNPNLSDAAALTPSPGSTSTKKRAVSAGARSRDSESK